MPVQQEPQEPRRVEMGLARHGRARQVSLLRRQGEGSLLRFGSAFYLGWEEGVSEWEE